MEPEEQVVRSIVLFKIPDFSLIAFSNAIEPLRLANRILGYEAYQWRFASVDGLPVTSSCNCRCVVDTSLEQERRLMMGPERPTMVLVCSGLNVEQFHNKSALAWLREVHNRNIDLGALCTGAHVLAKAGLLNDRRCAIHWENLPGFQEAFPHIEVQADLYHQDGNIYSCAGGTAPLDMMLDLVRSDFDDALVNQICEQVLTDRVRASTDRQRLPLRARLGVQNAKVLSIIEMMEQNLTDPLPLVEISGRVNLSRRHIERLFRQEMGRSPARYYLEVRLDRARYLLAQSTMPVVDVAVACGFVSASHFSKCYREHYHRSPQQERNQRKQLLAA